MSTTVAHPSAGGSQGLTPLGSSHSLTQAAVAGMPLTAQPHFAGVTWVRVVACGCAKCTAVPAHHSSEMTFMLGAAQVSEEHKV